MALRSWLKLLAATTTAAAVVGAGQLGIAYGLGMVRLDQALDFTQRDQWTAQLAWVAWITMTAAAIGAVVATGLRPRWSPRPVSSGGALGMGLAAGLGALAVLPLTMQPARTAQVAGVQPVLVIGICAALGAAVGIFAGYAAAARAAARWSLSTLTVAVWFVALISVAPSLAPGKTQPPVRLGVLEGSLIPAGLTEYTRFATMPAIALIAGLVIGLVARGRKMPALAVALSGLAGPALLTVAYLIAGPGSAGGFRLDPYWGAMTAAGAGVLGSVLAAIVRSAPGATRTIPEPETPAAGSPDAGSPNESEPDPAPADTRPEPATASGRAALPRRDVPVQSAIAQAAAAAARRPEDELRPSDTGVLPLAPGNRPHPLQDLGNKAASGFGGQPTPLPAGVGPATVYPPASYGQAPSPAFNQASGPASAAFNQAQPPASGTFSQPSGPAAAAFGQAPAGAPAAFGQANPEPRFSGQQQQPPAKAAGGLRRGWRTRKPAPEPQPATPSPALTGDSGSFNGFTANQPGPRTGIDTAEHPRIASRAPLTPEPTPISAPLPQPTPIAPPPTAPSAQGRKEDDYVNWVNGLGGA
ncbi:hypothetical protein SAMN05421541_110253 [Actinoplanes philippinensis]|uniref:Uncharacterized protein n=1 Tax=Actinoplanes philippinensis TaxID=35752 RepID=A0A1I2IN30_9ACTN|nr:hypothetical protein [Actinoplanes philippinensis]SFF43674.1 hypothetical protein SAMN05421541_110253 [Actinoplanes philippinensis]